MNGTDTQGTQAVALYWDFENLHASLSEAMNGDGSYGKQDGRFKVQDLLVNVQAIIELAASYGPVAINRAYCNWQFFGRYRDALLQGAVELVQLFPPGPSAKNGADIKLCLDAAEDILRFQHTGTVLITERIPPMATGLYTRADTPMTRPAAALAKVLGEIGRSLAGTSSR